MLPIFIIVALVTGTEPVAKPSQDVIVQLANGNRITGTLLEHDGEIAVVAVKGGKMRFDLRKVERILPVNDSSESSEPVPNGEIPQDTDDSNVRRITLPVAPATCGNPRALIVRVPLTWKEVQRSPDEFEFAFPKKQMSLKVVNRADAKSIWNSFTHVKSQYAKAKKEFVVKGERFGDFWEKVRIWEIDFVHRASGKKFRERHLYLDFGANKTILQLRSTNKRFEANSSIFSSIVGGLEVIEGEAEASSLPVPPVETSPKEKDTVSIFNGAVDRSRETIKLPQRADSAQPENSTAEEANQSSDSSAKSVQ